ncbi:hypothetical protein [Lysinibacillus xylanilyticus]|uniref:hypothetical protein n=1 Tax=Lysinibacillus xylanilyticus TaxID=582475 RepID=UPI003D00924D
MHQTTKSTKCEIKPVLGTTTIEGTPKCIVTLYQFELNRLEHRTIVMVLHNLNLACRYADHIVAIHNQTVEMVQEVFGMEVAVSEDPFFGTPLCITKGKGRYLK